MELVFVLHVDLVESLPLVVTYGIKVDHLRT